MLGWLAFLSVGSVLGILSLNMHGVSSGLTGVFLYGYSFLVLHSLRENIREEIAQGVNMQINQQNAPSNYAESAVDPAYAQSYQQQNYP